MLVRIFIVAALVLGLMLAVKDGRLPRAVGLSAACAATRTASDGSVVDKCHPGKLEGLPNLESVGCTSLGRVGKDEYWSCPAPLAASPSTR
jgi:hypothetical protein